MTIKTRMKTLIEGVKKSPACRTAAWWILTVLINLWISAAIVVVVVAVGVSFVEWRWASPIEDESTRLIVLLMTVFFAWIGVANDRDNRKKRLGW